MAASKHIYSAGRKIVAHESGQAAVEFALVAALMLVLLLAIIDFGRALNYMQVMVGLTRQGSNLASRGTSLAQSAAAVVAGSAPLNLGNNGEVTVTSVANINNVNTITGQASQGGISCTSRIGQGVGNRAAIPSAAATMLQNGQTIFITEVCYSYQPITPIGNFVKTVMPSTLYEAAYF
jgi:Flp pilus assembly protein TadG